MSIEESDLKLLLKALQFSALKHKNQVYSRRNECIVGMAGGRN